MYDWKGLLEEELDPEEQLLGKAMETQGISPSAEQSFPTFPLFPQAPKDRELLSDAVQAYSSPCFFKPCSLADCQNIILLCFYDNKYCLEKKMSKTS